MTDFGTSLHIFSDTVEHWSRVLREDIARRYWDESVRIDDAVTPRFSDHLRKLLSDV